MEMRGALKLVEEGRLRLWADDVPSERTTQLREMSVRRIQEESRKDGRDQSCKGGRAKQLMAKSKVMPKSSSMSNCTYIASRFMHWEGARRGISSRFDRSRKGLQTTAIAKYQFEHLCFRLLLPRWMGSYGPVNDAVKQRTMLKHKLNDTVSYTRARVLLGSNAGHVTSITSNFVLYDALAIRGGATVRRH